MKCFTFLSALLLFSCSLTGSQDRVDVYSDYDIELVPYSLYDPDVILKLHQDLEEISGLAYYKKDMLLAIEDESGNVYYLNADDGKVIKKRKFAKSGDYESIEIIGDTAYIMQSDGDLYSLPLEGEEYAEKKETAFSSKNDMEGMGEWLDNLLVVTKQSGDAGGINTKGKGVYLINRHTAEVESKAFLEIPLKRLKRFVKDRKHFNVLNEFDPSGIAVHPITHDIYILSADKVLLVYSDKLEIKDMAKLNGKLMKQPEGICFSPDGTLFISSEGDGSRGRLLKYSVFRPNND